MFTLPELPYSKDALTPHISPETFEFHYGKHHKAYVDKLNELTANTPQANKSLEELIKTSEGPIFNNAAQVWNHTFFWSCMSPKGGGDPKGKLADAINKQFGSTDKFREQFSNKAVTLFGAGWAWLCQNSAGELSIEQMSNAGNPMTKGLKPILTLDVWEHAYYIDYRNARPKFVEAFWKLVNWQFAETNLK
jgi:Fe-Mn family superoxide dismutase